MSHRSSCTQCRAERVVFISGRNCTVSGTHEPHHISIAIVSIEVSAMCNTINPKQTTHASRPTETSAQVEPPREVDPIL